MYFSQDHHLPWGGINWASRKRVNGALLPWEESRQARDGERLEVVTTEETVKERESLPTRSSRVK